MTARVQVSRSFPLVAVWLSLTAAAVLLQWGAGAFGADFGGHPDEGAHFVTGLMVRDYLASGFPGHPMRYAENYYAHYPKVALGHYPPGFYALEGVWLAVFPVSRASGMALMAGLCGTLGTIVFAGARRVVSLPAAAVAVAGVAVCLPLTQTMTSTVMSDLLLAVLVVLSARSFIRYMERGRWADSLAFGVLAAAAVMTKGSGLFLGLLPPVAIMLTGKYHLLKRWSLWIAPLPVLVVCGPWLYLTSGITAEGMVDRGSLEHLKLALPYFARQGVRVFGFLLLVPAMVGTFRVLRDGSSRRDPFWAVVASIPVCLVVFYSVVPAGLEPRYLLPAVPSILLLSLAGFRWLLSQVPIRRRMAASWLAGAIGIGLFFAETFELVEADFAGYRASVRVLTERAGSPGEALNLLVSSDARGEGAFVSEVAVLDRSRPTHTVDRASKVLARSDWLGRGYREAFESDAELLQFLREAQYDGILVDEGIPEVFLRPHHQRIARVLESGGMFTRLEGPPAVPAKGRGGRNALYVRVPAVP